MDPKDGWEKTWAYLAELGKYIEYYPTGTGPVFKELAEGSRDMVASHIGWDINTRILGVVPKEAETVHARRPIHWVTDAHYWAIPKRVAPGHLAVLLELTKYMLGKTAQAMTYDKGYFYPGPAVKDVPLSMAPEASRKSIGEYTRAYYEKAFVDVPSGGAAIRGQAGLRVPALGPAGRRASWRQATQSGDRIARLPASCGSIGSAATSASTTRCAMYR